MEAATGGRNWNQQKETGSRYQNQQKAIRSKNRNWKIVGRENLQQENQFGKSKATEACVIHYP